MNKKNPKLTYQKAYQFPQETHDFIEGLMKGKTLHCCCGNSLLGDIRIDIEKQPDQDTKDGFIEGDVLNLKEILDQKGIGPNYFDTVICDPLWHLPYQKRPALGFILRDQVKLGGQLIFNALWIPNLVTMKIENIWVGRNRMAWRNIGLVIQYRKTEEGYSETILKEKESRQRKRKV